jgi:hypothetical protein
MEQYSDEAKEMFKRERNWKIGISLLIMILLYLAGALDLIFPSIF